AAVGALRPRTAAEWRAGWLSAADVRDREPLVVVRQDLLGRLPREGHSLRAPLRHSDAMTVPAAAEDETRRHAVLPPADSRLAEAIGVAEVEQVGLFDLRPEELQL